MDVSEKFDTSNPVIAKILQARQERLKMLQEMNKEYQEELKPYLTPEVDYKKKLPKPRKKKQEVVTPVPVRRSGRLSNTPVTTYREDFFDDEIKVRSHVRSQVQSHQVISSKTPRIRPPNDYGPMPGIEVGHHWETRMECSYDGVHRPTVAGIHAGPDGAYSIALSGGYPEDIDEGHTFTYTGAGGRDLKGTAMKPKNLRTAPQTKDQELTGVNYSLVKSIETELPIRVIRGYKSPSPYAPEYGYRYDGLYKVVRYWNDVGKTGFRVFRFEMVRMDNQLPAPWEPNFKEELDKHIKNSEHHVTKDSNNGKSPSSDSESEEEEYDNESDKENKDPSSTEETALDLEVELKKCEEKLCQNSVDFSSIIESLKNHVDDLSFYGWE